MPLKSYVNRFLNRRGYVVTKIQGNGDDPILRDIPEITPFRRDAIERTAPFTMTGTIRQWALIQSLVHINREGVSGDIVECGVWRGGNLILAMLILKELGDERSLWGFDTFAGMPRPTEIDRTIRNGHTALEKFLSLQRDTHNDWNFAPLEEVVSNMEAFGFQPDRCRLVKGKCEDTLQEPSNLPDQIAVLRLDTDWYESTRMELNKLYPRLSEYGVLIIDDYGHWEGVRKAVDEYFEGQPVFMHRIDYACRLIVKS